MGEKVLAMEFVDRYNDDIFSSSSSNQLLIAVCGGTSPAHHSWNAGFQGRDSHGGELMETSTGRICGLVVLCLHPHSMSMESCPLYRPIGRQ